MALQGARVARHGPGLLCLALNRQTAGPSTSCQMAALYTRSGTVSGTVCERLSALQISLMHLEDGARPVLAAAMVMGLN